MEWQPIETAPRDGTWVMLWRGASEYGIWHPVVFGRWYELEPGDAAWVWPDGAFDPFSDDGRDDADYEIEKGGLYHEDCVSFTHWMPLPAPPKATP